MSNKLIICQQSGTILYVEHCTIVDTNELTAEEVKTLFEGGDGDAIEIADQVGKELRPMLDGCGYGDLNYSNCIAFSPNAIRQELEENIEFYFPMAVDDPEGEESEDAAKAEYFTALVQGKSGEEKLQWFAGCLNSDHMWDTFTRAMREEIEIIWSQREGN
jgi:hypothetical protein